MQAGTASKYEKISTQHSSRTEMFCASDEIRSGMLKDHSYQQNKAA